MDCSAEYDYRCFNIFSVANIPVSGSEESNVTIFAIFYNP
jgi:hypothetical protein